MRRMFYFKEEACAGCRDNTEMIEETMKDIPIRFFTIDCIERKGLADFFKVERLPTFVLLESNDEIARHVGVLNKEQLQEFASQ